MESKVCTKCLVEKPLSEYHRDKGMKSGLRNVCKECACQRAREHLANARSTREGRTKLKLIAQASRAKHREEIRSSARARNSRRYRAGYRYQDDPHKRRARGVLRTAVHEGRIVKPDQCSECGWVGRVHGHHEDYSKPLEVVWLCAICHGLRHRKAVS